MATETFLRRSIPVFINSFNQLTYLRDSVNWFAAHGFRNVFVIDNASAYPPLLDYYQTDEFRRKTRLISLGENIGPRKSMFRAMDMLGPEAPFIFTDPDLLLPEYPDTNMISFMFEVGEIHGLSKVGLALDISQPDLFKDAERYKGTPPAQWERRFWNRPLGEGVFRAAVDTTFFLHTANPSAETGIRDRGLRQAKIPAARIARPGFICKHRPWYKDCGQTEDEKSFYADSASAVASWNRTTTGT